MLNNKKDLMLTMTCTVYNHKKQNQTDRLYLSTLV